MGFRLGKFKKEVCPNDCYFSCIFSTSNKGKNNISYIRSEPIDFEVLPSTPVLTLNKIWTEKDRTIILWPMFLLMQKILSKE